MLLFRQRNTGAAAGMRFGAAPTIVHVFQLTDRVSSRRVFTTRAHAILSLLILTSGAVLTWTCLRNDQLEDVGVQDNLQLIPVLEDFTAVSATLFLVLGVLGLVASVFLSGLLYLHLTMAIVLLTCVVFVVGAALFAKGYIMRLHVSMLVNMLNRRQSG